ncbi:MAG: ROK family protein [Candidatus Hermodarchaeota archaeon]
MSTFVGVDIGATNIRVILASKIAIIDRKSEKTVKKGENLAVSHQIIRMTTDLMNKHNTPQSSLKGIGISACGPFLNERTIARSPNLCKDNTWQEIPIIDPLEHHFGSPLDYKLRNDCVAAVWAEHLFGSAQNIANCLYITVSSGVGGGFVLDGQLIIGKRGNAGHVGHQILKMDGPMCNCGQRGCLEALVAGTYLEQRLKRESLCDSPKELFQMARDNNPRAQEIVAEIIQYLSIGIINAISISDVQIVILGGSIITNNVDLLLNPIREYVKAYSYSSLTQGTQIVTTELGEYVAEIGGLALVMPKDWVSEWRKTRPWKVLMI